MPSRISPTVMALIQTSAAGWASSHANTLGSGAGRINSETTSSWWVGARHWAGMFRAPKDADLERWPLPTWSFLLYYPLRLIRLIEGRIRDTRQFGECARTEATGNPAHALSSPNHSRETAMASRLVRHQCSGSKGSSGA